MISSSVIINQTIADGRHCQWEQFYRFELKLKRKIKGMGVVDGTFHQTYERVSHGTGSQN